ncbi:heavy-metal-associated domain-containing protein [Helicobacter enhydrae]|uniref:heavy-metal-associated domain-containing protein n=1 Tax=Helicobacter enhydrae TaxID=222136 RepID=UPI000A058932|nr:heavy metal-associated domain-containing protein [Helicobacter enhydrae]
MQTLKIRVPKMTCSHCTQKIETFVSEVEGVQNIQYNLETKEVEVKFIAPATEEKIIEAINDCGFEVN